MWHTISINFRFNKKAHRLSTVHCGCSPPYSPCVMCCGRTNNIQTQPDIAGLSVPEKYALIDHDYHIVLSDPKDTGEMRRFKLVSDIYYCLFHSGLEPRMAAAATINSTRQRPLK